jgi:hypothetical protein
MRRRTLYNEEIEEKGYARNTPYIEEKRIWPENSTWKNLGTTENRREAT